MALSGKLWPLHLKPKEDELLSSWFVRLAWAHGHTVHELCQYTGPDVKFTERDIDLAPLDTLLAVLAEKTGTELSRVHLTTLKNYEGFIFEQVVPGEITPWILPIGALNHSSIRHGIPYCPACLAEDETPYYRRKWRLAYVTVCYRHKIMLVDNCKHCLKPVNLDWKQGPGKSHADCLACGRSLTSCNTFDLKLQDIDKHIAWQRHIDEIVERGGVDLNGSPVHSALFFRGLRQMMYLLSHGPKSEILRTALTNRVKCPNYYGQVRLKDIETLSVSDRLCLLARLGWLLEKWPIRFTELCRSKRVASSDLFGKMKNIPYWYEKTVKNLNYTSKRPSHEEIDNAISFLVGNGLPVCESNLELLLGVNLRNVVNFTAYPWIEFRSKYPEGESIGGYAVKRAIEVFNDEEKAMKWLQTPKDVFNFKRPIDMLVYLKGLLAVVQELLKIRNCQL